MRQRITPEQLTSALNESALADANAFLDKSVADLKVIKPAWREFCQEKSDIAIESWTFFFRQWVQLHRKGYPSVEQPYLALLDRNMVEIKMVYLAFFRLHSGLIYELRNTQPAMFIWLMLSTEFEHEPKHLLAALSLTDRLSEDEVSLLLLHAKHTHLDITLALLIEGNTVIKDRVFNALTRRQTLSVGLAKHWLKTGILSEEQVHPVLARFDVEASIEWVKDANMDEAYLFELLLCKHDRATWFRQRFGIDQAALDSAPLSTYAKLLELAEFQHFDPDAGMAPVQMALSGRPDWAQTALAHIVSLDESEGEEWLFALFVIYGDGFPLSPQALGIEYSWEEALAVIEQWRDQGLDHLTRPTRLGELLTFDSTLNAMNHTGIPERYRVWLWRQICIHGRVYIPWHWTMPVNQQQWLFSKLPQQVAVIERFNLRNQNATLGY
ncbi:hypothetical protein ACFFUP_09535 [Vibrio ostreicida]|uniref:TIGR02270 family protein n=1 Tax=Vibrio ostreicida TaxID=526588 RepID=A0ABT8C0B2_9VIBR|nr:hypothetical protein [Vibrio ostreicida]MDN3611785.1 hypothetical protein [Vibrio ostreicida]NPD09600.1 hypothetical protein [Vibrio ostreicida]